MGETHKGPFGAGPDGMRSRVGLVGVSNLPSIGPSSENFAIRGW